jgi:hypothetical protein
MAKFTVAWTWGGYTTVEAEDEEQAYEIFKDMPAHEIVDDLESEFDPDIVRVTEGEE